MPLERYITWNPRQGRVRAIVKTVCYRIFMVVITILIAFLVTNSTGQALSIGLAANLFKTVTYYVYERAWNRITWGITDPQPGNSLPGD